MNVEGRERFFRAIAERIDVERVEEVHVFPAIRQGGRESGVAVLTLRPESVEPEFVEPETGVGDVVDSVTVEDAVEDAVDNSADSSHVEGAEPIDATGDAGEADSALGAEVINDADSVGDVADGGTDDDSPDAEGIEGVTSEPGGAPPPAQPPRRFTVLRAHYRLQLKGPDRGKWEVSVVEEADAPAATVDEVVRGVHERAGGWSVEGPEHLTGDEFRAALVEEPWSATR